MAITLKYASREQLLAATRAKYAQATGTEVHRLAAKIATEFTDTEIRSAFGLSQAQLASFKARLNSNAATYATINSARGE